MTGRPEREGACAGSKSEAACHRQREREQTRPRSALPRSYRLLGPNASKLSDRGWPSQGWNSGETRWPASVRWSAWLGTAPTERLNGDRHGAGRGNDGRCRPTRRSEAEGKAGTRDADTKRAERERARLGEREPACHSPTEKERPRCLTSPSSAAAGAE